MKYHRFAFFVFGVAGVALVLASLVIEKGDCVLWINGHHTLVLDSLMIFVTQLGSGLLFIPLLVATLFIRFRYAVLTAAVWVGHGVVSAILKRGIFGPVKRPIALLDNSELYFVPNVDVHSFFSFPSGHTATIFCFALLVSLLVRNHWTSMGLLAVALLVGYSRIYLLQHFLVDVAWGAVVGVVCTYGLWMYFQRAKLPSWMNSYLKINRDWLLRLRS